MADLAKLVVRLEAETAKLHKDLDKSQNKLKRFEKTANRAGKALKQMAVVGGAGLVALGVGMTALGVKIINTADRIGKLKQTTGVAVKTLSSLRLGASLSGVEFESLAKGVGRLQRNMFDANQGLKASADAFDILGVNVTDGTGKLKDTEKTLLEVADKFQGMADGAEKAALAQILFGRAGASMIPFLNQGAEGIRKMQEESEALGLTMDGQLTKAAENTNDNLTRLKMAMEGVFLRVIGKALPFIEKLTKRLVAWAKESGNVSKAIQGLTNFGKGLLTVFYLVKGVLESLVLAGASLAAGLMAAAKGNFSEALDIIKMGAEGSDKAWSDATSNISNLWKQTSADIVQETVKTGEAAGQALTAPIVKAEGKMKEAAQNMKKTLSGLQSEFKKASSFAQNVSKEFKGRNEKINAPKEKDAKDLGALDVSLLQLQSQKALKNGDFDGAVDKARKAFDLLDKMKEAGAVSDLVLQGLGDRLARLGDEIGEGKMAEVKANIGINIEQAQQAAAAGNQAMQAVLDANPLVQKIITQQTQGAAGTAAQGVNPDLVPNAATQKSEQPKNLTPINLTLPNGDKGTFFGDKTETNKLQQNIQREALKRGTR